MNTGKNMRLTGSQQLRFICLTKIRSGTSKVRKAIFRRMGRAKVW